MKQRFIACIACILAICCIAVISCKKQTAESKYITYGEMESEFQSTLNAEDSLQVLERAEELMQGLKNGEVEESLSKLHMVKDGNLVPIAGETLDQLISRFKMFPVVNYKLEYFAFSVAQINDLKYSLEIGKRNASGKAPTMGFMLNPMKVDGVWYLCVKGENQSSKEMLNPITPNSIVGKRE